MKRAWLLAIALSGAAGCVSVENQWSGETCSQAALASLRAGTTTLAEALSLLGAPQEFHAQHDGLLLLYRLRSHHLLRVGLDPSWVLRFIPLDSVAAQAARNVKYLRETGDEDEDRVVLYFDPQGRLLAQAQYLGARPR